MKIILIPAYLRVNNFEQLHLCFVSLNYVLQPTFHLSSTMPPKNRKQRREAAAAALSPATEKPSIPLSHPPRTSPTDTPTRPKTLYDIIAERQNALLIPEERYSSESKNGVPQPQPGTRVVTVDASGAVVDAHSDTLPARSTASNQLYTKSVEESNQNDESETHQPLPPFLDTILLSLPLTTLHLTLAWLAAHQYAEETNLPVLLKDSILITFPLLTFLIHLAHGHIISFPFFSTSQSKSKSKLHHTTTPPSLFPLTRDKLTISFLRNLLFPPSPRTLFFLPFSVLLGAQLIAITNGEPYYAVMKKAPSVGTLWIWCILEMSVGAAALGALGPLVWGVWWMGYGII